MKVRTSVLAILGLAFASGAMAETVNCTPITSVPYTIGSSGTYCFTRNLTANMPSSTAITIAANDVVLDMNGFALDNSTAGSATQAIGIGWGGQRGAIRNGTLRGFAQGINSGAEEGVIENMLIVGSTMWGMYITADSVVIRNNRIAKTGGSPTFGMSIGMWVSAQNARIINNDISDVVNGLATSYGIFSTGSNDSVIADNRVSKVSTTCTGCMSNGIYLGGATNATVRDNIIADTQYGVYFYNTTGKYMNNMTQGVTTPYTGGTPAGSTNY